MQLPIFKELGITPLEDSGTINDLMSGLISSAKSKSRCVGYLPWKLLQSNICTCDKKAGWAEHIAEPIRLALEEINMIRSADNPSEVFHKLYPSRGGYTSCDDIPIIHTTEYVDRPEADIGNLKSMMIEI